MKLVKLTALLILFTTSPVSAANTIYSDEYGSCWKTLKAAQKYPNKPTSKEIRAVLGCESYKIIESGADTCGSCKWINSYTKLPELKCKGYVIAHCK